MHSQQLPIDTQVRGLLTLLLDGNRIERLPAGLGQLSKLTVLNLSGNGLTQLPDELCEVRYSIRHLHDYKWWTK
jgi:Leucine-rich repeat (LRR) protein